MKLRRRLISCVTTVIAVLFILFCSWLWMSHDNKSNYANSRISQSNIESIFINLQQFTMKPDSETLQQMLEEFPVVNDDSSSPSATKDDTLKWLGTSDSTGTKNETSSAVIAAGFFVTASYSHCDNECTDFRRLFEKWPPGKPKAGIYYLSKADQLHLLRTSLQSLEKYFNVKYGYPVVIFYEEASSEILWQQVRTFVNFPVFFQRISFDFPSSVNRSAVVYNIPCLSHIGYRHMCRFHALAVYQQPILKGLEYILRLDDDSLFLAPIQHDLFKKMKIKKYLYGYLTVHWDSLHCTRDLWPATRNYARKRRIKTQFLDEWPIARIFYNNFEISALGLWTSTEYQDYIKYIDSLGGIYYHRWGDAPIKSLAVSMFVPRNRMHKFTNIAYKHNSFVNNTFV